MLPKMMGNSLNFPVSLTNHTACKRGLRRGEVLGSRPRRPRGELLPEGGGGGGRRGAGGGGGGQTRRVHGHRQVRRE